VLDRKTLVVVQFFQIRRTHPAPIRLRIHNDPRLNGPRVPFFATDVPEDSFSSPIDSADN
jgi:hypothetical protein